MQLINHNHDLQINRATLEDVPRLLDLHYQTFNSQSNQLLLLGTRFMVEAFRWYCQDKNAFALVAEHREGLAGYITVNRGSYYYMLQQNWPHVLMAFLLNPKLACSPAVVQRVKNIFKTRRELTAHAHQRACLAYLAVDRELAAKRTSSALVQAALIECHSRGWSEVLTAYRCHNMPARMLYAMLGFKYFPELNQGDLVCVRFDTNLLKNAEKCAPVVA